MSRAPTPPETEDRRGQLLRIGTELFATQPYDEVWITEVARAAGVSRGLLYHYFPGKRAFFTEIIRVETDEMARLTDSDASLPAGERVRLGIDAYLDYAEQHEPGYRAMHRAATGADSEIRTLVERLLDTQTQRIIDGMTNPAATSPMMRLAVRAWLSFLITACLDWLDNREPSRDALRELCVETLLGAIAAVSRAAAD